METPTQMGSDMSWLQDPSPMVKTPRTPQTSRTHTPEPNSFVNPSSALLQDLLKEQRATRGARTGSLEELEGSPQRTPEWLLSQSQTQLSQSQSHSQEEPGSDKRQSTKMSSNGSVRRPLEMGVRETDQYISKISKQNFDLKLEIFHRVQQLSLLEKKLERMQELEDELERMRGLEDEVQELRAAEEDNQRLREANEQLQTDIDKRDQAVTEAVDLICELETRVEELETDGEVARPSVTHLPLDDESGLSTPRNASLVDIPERTSSRRDTRQPEGRRVSSGSRILQRAPSFLLEESKSTAALRSLYVETEDHLLPEPSSVPQPTPIAKSESMNSMTETAEAESPRLSALSECSELQIDDSPIPDDGFDQIDIPVRQREANAQGASLSSLTLGMSDRDLVRMSQWFPSESKNVSEENVTPRKTQRLSDVFKKSQTSSPSSSFNSSSHKSKMESIFGSARLPPTPDTMTTTYPAWANDSSDSTIAKKSQSDLRRCLTRTRSADELTARRSSMGEPRESMDTNVSKATMPRPSLDSKDEDPAIYPLDSIQQRYGHYASTHGLFHGDFERVLARMDKDYYSPSRAAARDDIASLGSSPRSLTAEDWMEAARPGTRNRAGPIQADSQLVGSRAPSQSSFLGRRHSIDSAVREPTLPFIQTYNLRSMDDDNEEKPAPTEPELEPEPEPRRRISLLPQFFSRSVTARRLQPSPISDPAEKDDGAPAPIIRKTRVQPPKATRPVSGQIGEFTAGPTYAEEGMYRSFTEANPRNSMTSPSAHRPTTSNGGKDMHRRRGSLGLFGWMKGASAGLGSSLKKSEAAPPSSFPTKVDPQGTSTAPAPASTNFRASSRLAAAQGDGALGAPELTQAKPAEPAEEFATRTRHPSRTDEPADEHGRRPRYMERRSRRT